MAPISGPEKLNDFASELAILTGITHPGITNYVDGYYFGDALWIIIELASGGSIGDIIKKRHRGLSEEQLKCCSYQLLGALDYLHKNAVIHRDLNASNVLIGEGGVLKIADFGVSAKCKSEKDRRNSFIGTPNVRSRSRVPA